MSKGGNADKQHFLLYAQCLLPYERQTFCVTLNLSSTNTLNLEKTKILSSGKCQQKAYPKVGRCRQSKGS